MKKKSYAYNKKNVGKKYYCMKCKKHHIIGSKIAKKHLWSGGISR